MEESTLRWPTDKEREEMEEVIRSAANKLFIVSTDILKILRADSTDLHIWTKFHRPSFQGHWRSLKVTRIDQGTYDFLLVIHNNYDLSCTLPRYNGDVGRKRQKNDHLISAMFEHQKHSSNTALKKSVNPICLHVFVRLSVCIGG